MSATGPFFSLIFCSILAKAFLLIDFPVVRRSYFILCKPSYISPNRFPTSVRVVRREKTCAAYPYFFLFSQPFPLIDFPAVSKIQTCANRTDPSILFPGVVFQSIFSIVCVYEQGLSLSLWERPYQHDSTASRLLSEVKHVRAQLVLRWGTTLES